MGWTIVIVGLLQFIFGLFIGFGIGWRDCEQYYGIKK